MSNEDLDILKALAAPFPANEVHFKPGSLTQDKKRCLAMAHIDARAVMDRLDQAVGPANWKDEFEHWPDGTVVCKLSLRLGAEWVTKCDVGNAKAMDAEDKGKTAFSTALKRAAVKFGIGRYLYHLDRIWCEYDPVKKRITNPPQLPAWALPAGPAKHERSVAQPQVAKETPKPTTQPSSQPATQEPQKPKADGSLPLTIGQQQDIDQLCTQKQIANERFDAFLQKYGDKPKTGLTFDEAADLLRRLREYQPKPARPPTNKDRR